MSDVSQKVLTGHLVQIVMRGVVIANCRSVTDVVRYGQRPVRGIALQPFEHVPTQFGGEVTIDRFFMRYSSLAALGLAAMNAKEILMIEPVTIQVNQKASMVAGRVPGSLGDVVRGTIGKIFGRGNGPTSEDVPVVVYHDCSLDTRNSSFMAGTTAGENARFLFTHATGPDYEATKSILEDRLQAAQRRKGFWAQFSNA